VDAQHVGTRAIKCRGYARQLSRLASTHEFDDQFRAIHGVGLEKKMRAVENVRFHPRQILQPGEDLSAVEEAVVPSPQHERARRVVQSLSMAHSNS